MGHWEGGGWRYDVQRGDLEEFGHAAADFLPLHHQEVQWKVKELFSFLPQDEYWDMKLKSNC